MHGQPLLQCCFKTFDVLVRRKPRGLLNPGSTCDVFQRYIRCKYGVRATLPSSSCKASKRYVQVMAWWGLGTRSISHVDLKSWWSSLWHKKSENQGQPCVSVC